MLARENLAHGEARVVHPGQRLDQRQIEAVVPPHDDVGGIVLPATARPTGTLREPVEHEPTDVVPRAGIPLTRIAEPDDDLQVPSWPRAARSSGQHDAARSRPNQPPESGLSSWEGLAAMVPGTASRRFAQGGLHARAACGPAPPRRAPRRRQPSKPKVCSVSASRSGALGSTRTECVDRIGHRLMAVPPADHYLDGLPFDPA